MDNAVILCASLGDSESLSLMIDPQAREWAQRAAALTLLDDAPDAFAALVLSAALGADAPASLRRKAGLPVAMSNAFGVVDVLSNIIESSNPASAQARAAIINVAAQTPRIAARVAAALWDALDDADRRRLATAASADAHALADLLERLASVARFASRARERTERDGQDGAGASDAFTVMARAAASDPCAAARAAALFWDDLDAAERVRLTLSAARDPDAAHRLMTGLGAARWANVARESRAALIAAVAQAPQIAARAAAALRDALDDADRRRLATAASADAHAAADLLTRIGANFLAVVSLVARATLIDAIANDGLVVAWSAGVIWDWATEEERVRLAMAAATRPRSAADCIVQIGAAGWAACPLTARAALLSAVVYDATMAARAAAAWEALDEHERLQLATAAARNPDAAADCIVQIGAAGWAACPLTARAALIRAVGRSPSAAMRAADVVGDVMSESERQAVRFALLEPAATKVIGQALVHGAPWRSWMAEAMPDAHASVEDAAIWLQAGAKAAMPPQELQRLQGVAALCRMQ